MVNRRPPPPSRRRAPPPARDQERNEFDSLLANQPIDAFLSVICVGFAYYVYSSKLRFAPVTSFAILAMIYAQLRQHYVTGSPTLNPSHLTFSFQPGAILKGKFIRLFAGQAVFYNKVHLLITLGPLFLLGSLEKKSSLPALGYFLFLAFLTSLVGFINVWLIKEFQPGDLFRSRLGFTGVVLALEVLRNYNTPDKALMFPSFFLDWLWDTSPSMYHKLLSTPPSVFHALDLAALSFVFPQRELWTNIAGVLAGTICAGVEYVFVEKFNLMDVSSMPGAGWATIVAILFTTLLFQARLREPEPQVNPEVNRSQQPRRSQQRSQQGFQQQRRR